MVGPMEAAASADKNPMGPTFCFCCSTASCAAPLILPGMASICRRPRTTSYWCEHRATTKKGAVPLWVLCFSQKKKVPTWGMSKSPLFQPKKSASALMEACVSSTLLCRALAADCPARPNRDRTGFLGGYLGICWMYIPIYRWFSPC